MSASIAAAWKSLHRRYSDVLGEDTGTDLTRVIHQSCQILEQS